MATVTDVEVANASFPNVRQDLNDILEALATNFSADAEPTTMYANQFWYETDTNLLKFRNEDNDAWITLAYFDQTNDEWEVRSAVIQAVDSAGVVIKTDDGTTRLTVADSGAVSINTSLDVDNIKIDGNTISSTDTNGNITLDPNGTGDINLSADVDVTGTITSDGADLDGAVVINESGADVDFRVESDTVTNALFVEGSSGNVGIGTSSPTEDLDITKSTSVVLHLERTGATSLDIGASTAAVGAYYDSSNRHQFQTSGTERMRIDSSGFMYIDRTSNISGNNAVLSVGGRNDTALNIYRNTTTGSAGVMNWTSDVGGSESIVGQLEANGDIENATGSYGSLSDERLKQDIVEASSQWDDIKALQVKNFRFIKNVEAEGDDAPTMLGVIAQDLEAAGMNGLVKNKVNEATGEEYKSVKYSILYMKAVKALQEAMERIETLEAKVATLEGN